MGRLADSREWLLLLAIALLALAAVAYLPAVSADFIWDDDDYVTENPTLLSTEGLRSIWFDLHATPQYYPLVHTSFWIEYRLWDLNPTGYHIVNILLHGFAAILLWTVLRRLQVPAAWLCAAVFALHPVHVESVAWITERKNLLSAVLYLAALLTYLSLLEPQRRQSAAEKARMLKYCTAIALFAGALFSKTVAASLPAAVLLIIWWKRGKITRQDVAPLLPFFVLGIGLGLLTAWMEATHVGATGEVWSLNVIERGLVAGRAVWFYLTKILWPLSLSFNYSRWDVDTSEAIQYLFPLGVVASLVVLYLLRFRIGRGPLAAALFFIGTLTPALGFFNVYPFRYSFVADHFQYLASIGPIAALIAGAASFTSRRISPRVVTAAATVLLFFLGFLTWQRCHAYQGLEALWRDTLRKNPESWIANNNLGNLLMRQGDFKGAIEHFESALDSEPTYKETYNNIAIALMNSRQFDDAERYARMAVELDPDYRLGLNTLGNALLRSGRPERAIEHFRKAVQVDPDYPEAHENLGTALGRLGFLEAAQTHLQIAIDLRPDLASAHSNLGIVLAMAGLHDQAMASFQVALQLDPENPVILQNIAEAESMIRLGELP